MEFYAVILFIQYNYNTLMVSIGHFSLPEITFKLINLVRQSLANYKHSHGNS